MIRLAQGRLRWSDADTLAMTRVLGADAAKKQATVIDSVIKQADRYGVALSPGCRRILEQARAERDALKNALTEGVVPTGYPADKLARLFPHQVRALAYMATRPAYLLADQPGVGKTPVAILWSERRALSWTSVQDGVRRSSREGCVLVLCPNSAKNQWAREIERWQSHGRDVAIVDGTIPQQKTTLREAPGWVVAHHESLAHAADAFLEREWGVVVLDEAQAIRNRLAARSRTAFSLSSPYRLALTGHPFFNAPDELWSILHFLYPSAYQSYWRFFSMHVRARPKFFGGFEVEGVRRKALLRWELKPFSLRRTKRQVYPDLPAIVRVPRYVRLPKTYAREYREIKRKFFAKLAAERNSERILTIPSVLARVTRMRQYLVDPGLLGAEKKSLKYPMVAELLEELDGPPVIFTSFRQAALRLAEFLGKRRTALIHGDMKTGERDRSQRLFLDGKLEALIVVTQAGGTALNLGRFGYVIFLDLPWSYAEIEQAEGRVDRPEEGTGRLVPTTSYRLIIEGTYEERLEKLIDTKRSMFDAVFTSSDEIVSFFD